MRIEERVERHSIKSSNPYYSIIMGFCRKSKDLYNHANYLVRQRFMKEGLWLRHSELDRILKSDTDYPDYRDMPTAQSAQQTLRMLDAAWASFFKSIKDWKRHKEKYPGRPKLPKYLKKDGHYALVVTNQSCRARDGKMLFPKAFIGFSMAPEFLSDGKFQSFQQVRFIPHGRSLMVELVYRIRVPDERPYNGRSIAIDIGVDNLATVVNNWNGKPFIINGRPLKSINQFSNRQLAHYKSVLDQTEARRWSKRLDGLMAKRARKLDDYLHKASRHIIDYCIENGVTKIVIGRNKSWKQDLDKKDRKRHSGWGRWTAEKVHQNFVQIPFWRFIQMIEYKAREHGLAVELQEEGYTSGTSFIDGEEPVRRNYRPERRVHRGLFVSDKGITINADVNGAFQIMRKVVPIKWDRGCVLHPVVVNMA